MDDLWWWCRVRDLNPRPTAYKAVALPAELTRPRDVGPDRPEGGAGTSIAGGERQDQSPRGEPLAGGAAAGIWCRASAGVAELVDTPDRKSGSGDDCSVRSPTTRPGAGQKPPKLVRCPAFRRGFPVRAGFGQRPGRGGNIKGLRGFDRAGMHMESCGRHMAPKLVRIEGLRIRQIVPVEFRSGGREVEALRERGDHGL